LPTATPIPTDTPTPTQTPTATLSPKQIADQRATEQAAQALEVIGPLLESYGFSSAEGQLGFYGEQSIKLSVNEYQGVDMQFPEPHPQAKNFVVQTDVKWESTGGLATCRLFLRADSMGGFEQLYD
jgi:hypothetical protein